MKRTPKPGEILPAFDDGKIRPSRLYVTEILEVVPFEKAKGINVYGIDMEKSYIEDKVSFRDDINLIDAWKYNLREYDWVFAETTDAFIHATVKGDVYEDQWFARMKNGGWFSLQIANYMTGATLDSDMSLFNSWKDHDWYAGDYVENKDKFSVSADDVQ